MDLLLYMTTASELFLPSTRPGTSLATRLVLEPGIYCLRMRQKILEKPYINRILPCYLTSRLSVMEDSIIFCQCRTLFRQPIQTSSVVPKVYQLVCELLVKRDEPIRLVASGIIHLVRDAWFVAIQTHTIVARRLEAKRCVLLCLYSWLF